MEEPGNTLTSVFWSSHLKQYYLPLLFSYPFIPWTNSRPFHHQLQNTHLNRAKSTIIHTPTSPAQGPPATIQWSYWNLQCSEILYIIKWLHAYHEIQVFCTFAWNNSILIHLCILNNTNNEIAPEKSNMNKYDLPKVEISDPDMNHDINYKQLYL